MSAAEIRANEIYNMYNLSQEDSEVKRMLMILLLTEKPENKKTVSYEEAFNSLPGAWENDGFAAEEEVSAIYNARVTGETRKIIEL